MLEGNYRKKVYSTLKKEAGLTISEEEFNKRLNSDPSYKKKVYSTLNKDMGLTISEDEFNNRLKKKESSEPTSQERPSASPTRTTQPSTSSATELPTRAAASVALGGPIKSATDIVLEGSRQIAQKEGEKVTPVNTFGQQEPDVFKGEYKDIATGDIKKTVPTPPQNKNLSVANDAYNYAIKNLDKQKSIDRLNDELNDWQLSDRISSGIKGVYNTLVANPYNALNELLGGDKDYFTSKEYRPLQLEMKQALKELKDEKGLKASISQEEIFEKAKQIFLKNDEQEQLHQLIDAALPRGYDREGVWKELKLKELNSNALLKSKIASAEVFKYQLESYNNVANAIKSGNATQEQISKFEDLKEKAIVAVDGLKYLQENFDTFLKEAKTDEEKLELFKYNYNDFEKNWNLLSASTKNIFAGSTKLLADTSIFLNQSKGDYVNPVANFLSDVSTEIMKDAEEQSAPFYRYKATKLNNWSDLGSFATQLGMEQIPVLTSIYFGGVPGTALVSTGSGGQKIYELEEQEKQPFGKKYSNGEKLAAGWLYSGAEFIPERLGTARILKDLERTVASASTTSRKMFMDSFFKNTFKGIGKASYYTGLEGGTELITAESQIAIDQELLDIVKTDAEKNELRAESFFSGALMGGGMAMAGGALGFAASQSRLYSERKDIKQVREILSKINDRNLQIENNKTLTEPEKTELYKEINDLNNQAFSIVERNAKKGEDLSIQEKSFLLDINKRQGELREKAKEISDSNYTKEYKKEKIKQLTDEFNSLEQKRNNTLQGKYSVLEELTDVEVADLKDQASRELMKELNPDGTETITIDDKQISNRAIEIYNNQKPTTAETITEAKPAETVDSLKDVESTANALNDELVNSIEEAANILFPKSDNTNEIVAEAYHKAKQDGSNPELVKAVENLLGVPTAEQVIESEATPAEVISETAVEVTPTTITYNGTEYSKNEAGNWVNNKTGNEVKGIGVKGKALISALNNMAETETITQPQPTVAEQAPKTEIEEALDDIVRPKTTNIKDQVDRAKKALAKIMKGVEIILHDTQESYTKATKDTTRGAYIDGKIHLNPAKADRTSVAHEVFHAVLLKYVADGKPATILTNKMLKAVARSLKGKPEVMATINEFVKNGYKGQKEIWSEEKLAEVLGYLASEYETLPQPTKNIIQKWLEKIAIMLKMKPFTDKEVIDFMNTLAERVREGQEITKDDVAIFINETSGGVVGNFNISREQKGVDAPKAKEDPRSFIRKFVEDIDIREFNGEDFITNMYDYTNAGETELGKGFKINLFGGKGYVPYMMELNNKKIGDVSNLAAFNTKAQAETFIRNSQESGAKLFAPHSGTKSKSWQFQQHTFAELVDLVLDKNILSSKELIDTFNNSINSKAIKEEFSNFSEKYGEKINNFDSFKSDPKKIVDLLDIKNNLSPNLRKALNNSIASNKTFQKAIGINNVSEFYNRIMDPLNEGVSGGEIIGVVKFDPNTFEIVQTKQNNIDHHPSFGWTLLAKINGIYQPSKFYKSYDITESYTKYNKGGVNVSIKSEEVDFDKKNVTSSAGAIPKVAKFNIKERRQISPENSSNYANMTEDGKGNFVFFHFGPRAIKFIDPKKYGSNKGAITSKPEVAAMGRVGGMSQFYTMPEYQESNVSGDKYMIKVPMDKVYDFNTDPDNLIGKAKEMFKSKYPDLPFTANDQVAFITKLAEKAGYDMTVAEWNGMSRAQSTKPLKPVDTQVMDGNTITKPFNENYESNSTKGFTAVVPVSKEAKLKEVYDNINNERNSQNRYDGLYRLREEASKKTQEEITKMIEESDISQEMKDAYAEAVAYEPAGRSSSRRQVNVKAIAENTKTDVDRIKGLPIKSVDGATFNMDGTKYEGGGLVVPMGSLEGNTTQERLSPEMIGEFAKDNQGKIGDDEIVKLGLYKFKDENTVSVDLNIVIPNKYREVALEFGALIGQESLYDLDSNENVKTGADGMNPVDLTDEQFRAAAASLKDGKMPQINVSRRQQPSALDRAVAAAKSRGFDDKTIMNYLVSRGYTSAEATKAVLKYNKAVAEKARQEEGVFTRAGRRRISIALDKLKRYTVSKRAFNTKTGLQLREFMEGNIDAELREARLALDEYDKMLPKDKAQRAAIEAEADKFLKGDSTANLPLEFKAVIGKFRTHIDNLSMRLVDTGSLTQSQADKLRSNIGQYVNRSYQVFDDPKWKDKVTEQMKEAVRNELRNLYYSLKGNVPTTAAARKTYGDKFAFRVEQAISRSDFDEDIILNKMIEDEINDMLTSKKASGFVGEKNIASKDLSILKLKNTEIPLSVRQLMGEYGNAGQNYAKTVQKLSALVYKAEFLKNMRDLGLGVFFFEQSDPNRDQNEFDTPIASEGSKTMNPLNGLYTTKELARIFKEDGIGDMRLLSKYFGGENGIGNSIMSALKMWQKTLGTIKKMKTAYSIGGHVKNVLGNIEIVLSNAYIDPNEYAKAFMTLKNSSKVGFKNKMDEYIRLGIVSSGDIAELKKLFNTDSFDSFLEKRLKNNYVKKSTSWVDDKLTGAYQAEDDFFKILGYEIEMKRYTKAYPNKSKEEIQKIVSNNIKNILPNYNRIGIIGSVMRSVPILTTFMSYQLESYRTAWNNIALAKEEMSSGNSVLRDVGRKRIIGALTTQVVKHAIMHSLGTVIFSPILSLLAGGDDDDEELTDYDKKVKYMNLMLPDFAKGDNVVITKEGNGEISYINFSSSDPRKGISNTISAAMQGKDPVDGFINGAKAIIEPFVSKDILLKAVSEMTNNETDSGAKIYEEADSDYEKSLKLTNFAWKVVQPGTYTSGEKIFKSDDPKNELKGQLTGYKTHKIDVKKTLYFKLKELKEYEQSAMDKYKKANRDFEDGKIDKEDRDKIQAQAQKSADKTYNEMRENLKAASYFGAKDYEIDEAFEKNRISDYVIKTLWSNEMPIID